MEVVNTITIDDDDGVVFDVMIFIESSTCSTAAAAAQVEPLNTAQQRANICNPTQRNAGANTRATAVVYETSSLRVGPMCS